MERAQKIDMSRIYELQRTGRFYDGKQNGKIHGWLHVDNKMAREKHPNLNWKDCMKFPSSDNHLLTRA